MLLSGCWNMGSGYYVKMVFSLHKSINLIHGKDHAYLNFKYTVSQIDKLNSFG
jgi:hypothetical protein